MQGYNPMTARRIVVEINRTHAAIDASLMRMTQLTSSFLAANNEAKLPAHAAQFFLEDMVKGLSTIIEGRGQFVSAHRKMVEMKNASNLKNVEIGCSPGPICHPFQPVQPQTAHLREVS
jgi:hypothetical protein